MIVPVLNEGLRLIGVLEKIRFLKIHELVDVVVVDGGSTDSSVDEVVLRDYSVNALLVVPDSLGLSAQLRVGFRYAVDQSYRGVLTIDGNGKDDPGAIPVFVKELIRGFDFVQGSRFVRGGHGVNTPLVRNVAIRFLHAPVLSLFSGFRWTDTTQGYRGYNIRVVQDSRVGLFRSIFQRYELLTYLSYRLPRLGYRCVEVATTRRYPKGEVPSKIKGIRANIELLGCLFDACFGRFNP